MKDDNGFKTRIRSGFVLPGSQTLKRRGAMLLFIGIAMLVLWMTVQSFCGNNQVEQEKPAPSENDFYVAETKEENENSERVAEEKYRKFPVQLESVAVNSLSDKENDIPEFYIQKKQEEKLDKQTTNTVIEKEDTYTGILQYEEGVSPSFLRRVEGYYLKVPENVRIHFQENGWCVFVSKQSLSKRFSFGSILGLLDADTKTIYIDNREKAVKTVLHEMGHYVDSKNGIVSKTGEFMEIYESEADSFCQIHSTNEANVSTSTEYFAECYEVYLQNPDILRNACPRTAAFIELYQSML